MKTHSLLDIGSWDLPPTLVATLGSTSLAQTVQELIQIAAVATADDGAPTYFPENFLTHW